MSPVSDEPPRRGQLDGERQAIQAAADGRRDFGVRLREGEVGSNAVARATNRRTASDSRSVLVAGLLRPVFAGTVSGSTTKARSPAMRSVSRLVTRTFRTIASGHESGHRRRRADDLFEVVQDQQQLPLVQSIDEALESG